MTFEEAVALWLRNNEPYAQGAYEIVVFGIRHEEAWSNDSGTDWPALTKIEYRVHKPNKAGKAVWSRKREALVLSENDDPFEFVRELFKLTDKEH